MYSGDLGRGMGCSTEHFHYRGVKVEWLTEGTNAKTYYLHIRYISCFEQPGPVF
jgi:hypothetical protein